MSAFEYYNSPLTGINVIGTLPDDRTFDNEANTVTYNDFFEVENKTGHTVDGVIALPYIWALAPDDGIPGDGQGTLGPAGPVALNFEDGAWTVEDFNGIDGLNLKVTAEILPDHFYTPGSIAAESIASNPGLNDDFGPSSADYPLKSKDLPPEILTPDDKIPSVNLGELEAKEHVTFDLRFTYHWTQETQDGEVAVDSTYNALPTSGAVYSLEPVDDLWLV